ncbi:MAG: NAD(P)/FAD-dependent oxidoreductase [Actinomycetota bacterium]|nr:NAD(P)/FAD-dependent oxidoreductase [Actinomycetota bacterium]MDI7251528.1 NAD(P)/FAD-dependent oxidoreductase [Actinomycetota bacterium]
MGSEVVRAGSSLWEPVQIGGLRLRNRTVMPAMGTGYASPQGEPTPRLTAYLRARAEGGVGLIITEVMAVHPLGKGFASELAIYDDSFLPGLSELAGTVKEAGAAVAAQLHHAGRETFPQVIGGQPVAPSPLPSRALGQVPRALTREEIGDLVACYAAAARRAREAGFDAVEVHGAHGYLVNQFLSPYSNRREDEYGGDATGRFRFAREVVRAVKEEAGRDFPVIFRFSASEDVKGGYHLDYLLPLLPLLVEDGVDAFHVSRGVYDSPGNPTCPGLHHAEGINVDNAAKVRETVGVPVIVVGKLHDPRLAEEVVASGRADLVAFGRQHLADPHFLAKAMEGRHEDIRPCLSCNQGCIERLMFEFRSITCTVNPECGMEWRRFRVPTARRGPFLVIGAGPAGLQAAMTLGEGGAEVRLLERDDQVGGQLRAASRPPHKEPYRRWVDWAVRRLENLGVRVETGRSDWRDVFKEGDWEGVVAASGADPVVPSVPGVDLPHNLEAREVLLEKVKPGKRVLVVGAGPVGMETADFLIDRGHEVTVVEEAEAPPVSPLTSHGYYLHRRLREHGKLLLGSRVMRVTKSGAIILRGSAEEVLEADSVVWAVGSAPCREPLLVTEEMGLRTVSVGDAVEPRRLLEAIHEGASEARKLLYPEEEPPGGEGLGGES